MEQKQTPPSPDLIPVQYSYSYRVHISVFNMIFYMLCSYCFDLTSRDLGLLFYFNLTYRSVNEKITEIKYLQKEKISFDNFPSFVTSTRMTTFLKTKYSKSDDQTNIDNIE